MKEIVAYCTDCGRITILPPEGLPGWTDGPGQSNGLDDVESERVRDLLRSEDFEPSTRGDGCESNWDVWYARCPDCNLTYIPPGGVSESLSEGEIRQGLRNAQYPPDRGETEDRLVGKTQKLSPENQRKFLREIERGRSLVYFVEQCLDQFIAAQAAGGEEWI